MKSIKIKVSEDKDYIKELLNNTFNEKIVFCNEDYDLRIIYAIERPNILDEDTIYLSETSEYGDSDTAGKLFGKIEYDKILPNLYDNDYYIREFIYYFRTKYLNEDIFAFSEVAITPKCNLACKHCSAANIKAKELPSFNDYKKYFDEFAEQGGLEITFTGGEPTMADGLLIDCVKYCTSKKISTGIISNGLNLNYSLLKKLKDAGMCYILISLYGREHDDFTQVKGSFEKSIKGLRQAKELGFYTMITTVASHKTLNNGDFEYLMNLAEEENIKLYFNYITPTGKFSNNNEDLLTEEDLIKIKNYLKLPLIRKNEKYFYGYTGKCLQAVGRIYVSPYGDFCPCPFIQISFGNIKNTSLDEVKENIKKSGYLKDKFETTCPASQSMDFINNFIKPIPLEAPVSYQEHSWFKEKEK